MVVKCISRLIKVVSRLILTFRDRGKYLNVVKIDLFGRSRVPNSRPRYCDITLPFVRIAPPTGELIECVEHCGEEFGGTTSISSHAVRWVPIPVLRVLLCVLCASASSA